MARHPGAEAVNARRVTVTDYGPDPYAWGWFRRLAGVLQRGHNGHTGLVVMDRQPMFNGWAQAPQSFSGMAPLGSSAPITPTTSTLPNERSAGVLESTTMRIFAERLRRGQS